MSASDVGTGSLSPAANGHNRLDAGMRSLDHYKNRLPQWHYRIRNLLIPVVRAETPYLARLQSSIRSPSLDAFFANTAVLGTHTFYMAFLPLLFWTGQLDIARGFVHILAAGVFFTGVFKDMLCLPRPLSPPLLRISKSHSAALEYGFPSTHSANAVSVGLYVIYQLRLQADHMPPYLLTIAQQLACIYVASIVFGRLYCGMHGFLDVIVGSLIGAALTYTQCAYGDAFDRWLGSGSITALFLVVVCLLVAIRMHPEPADDCPCFDDSVAFCGVLLGLEVAYWQPGRMQRTGTFQDPMYSVMFDFAAPAWVKMALRFIIGLFIIFAWRAIAKPTLLRALPPLFRIIESAGLLLPRRFFLSASEYQSVPRLRRDENLIPQASDISALYQHIRHPRKRTVSIGPQSEADAREVIASRETRRRQSQSAADMSNPVPRRPQPVRSLSTQATSSLSRSSSIQVPNGRGHTGTSLAASTSTHLQPPVPLQPLAPESKHEQEQEAKQDAAMFSSLQKPRVRYDVEVITKLIVYAGICWIAVGACPQLYGSVGLGIDGYWAQHFKGS